jgi:hypothetical protein
MGRAVEQFAAEVQKTFDPILREVEKFSRAQKLIYEQYKRNALAKKRQAHAHLVAVCHTIKSAAIFNRSQLIALISELPRVAPRSNSSPPKLQRTPRARRGDDVPITQGLLSQLLKGDSFTT